MQRFKGIAIDPDHILLPDSGDALPGLRFTLL